MPIPQPYSALIAYLCTRSELKNCVCMAGACEGQGSVTCQEHGRISWDNPTFLFLHIRFDGCICNDPNYKKCDCIIFRFQSRARPTMFVLETKGNTPSFSEVKEQIEFCINKMLPLLPNPKNQFKVVPVLCSSRKTSFMKEASLSNRVTIFGEKVPINLRLYTEDINDLG